MKGQIKRRWVTRLEKEGMRDDLQKLVMDLGGAQFLGSWTPVYVALAAGLAIGIAVGIAAMTLASDYVSLGDALSAGVVAVFIVGAGWLLVLWSAGDFVKKRNKDTRVGLSLRENFADAACDIVAKHLRDIEIELHQREAGVESRGQSLARQMLNQRLDDLSLQEEEWHLARRLLSATDGALKQLRPAVFSHTDDTVSIFFMAEDRCLSCGSDLRYGPVRRLSIERYSDQGLVFESVTPANRVAAVYPQVCYLHVVRDRDRWRRFLGYDWDGRSGAASASQISPHGPPLFPFCESCASKVRDAALEDEYSYI